MMKKAQATMETLLIYGAIFMIVILGIGALMYFGAGFNSFLPDKCNLDSTGLFNCEEWKITDSAKTVEVVLLNKGSKTIQVLDAKFEGKDAGFVTNCNAVETAPESDYTDLADPSTTPLNVRPGKKVLVQITCDSIDADVGEKIEGTITVTHKFADGALEATTVGDFMAAVS